MDERVSTRRKRTLDYYALNGGSDEEALPEDRLQNDEAEDRM